MLKKIIGLVMICFVIVPVVAAQDLAATMEVLTPSVEVQRVNTQNRIPVSGEVVIVGVGDTIFTGEEGNARITFFADGTTTELLPNTEYKIMRFEGEDDAFTLSVEVVVGQTVQQLERALDANSEYEVTTPSMTLAARGTTFTVGVESSGRARMLVTEGTVDAAAQETTDQVPAAFGVRSDVGETLSDVVRADNFAALDAAIDGCNITIDVEGDVLFNVRTGPARDAAPIEAIDPLGLTRVFGVSEGGNWYRVLLDEDDETYGWVLALNGTIAEGCAGLRQFPATHVEGADVVDATETTPEPEADSADS